MAQSASDILAAELAKLPARLQDESVRIKDRGNVQLHLPALLRQHISSTCENDTTAAADTDAGSSKEQQRQRLLQPSQADLKQLISTIDWQKLQVTALDLSRWDLQLQGWKLLLKHISRANAMRKLVLSNCSISGNAGKNPHDCTRVCDDTHGCPGTLAVVLAAPCFHDLRK